MINLEVPHSESVSVQYSSLIELMLRAKILEVRKTTKI